MSDTYQVGGSLRQNSPSYVVRQADLDLVMALNNGELSYVLNARQMGKSSLRVRTMHQLQQQGRKCGAVDLTLLGTRTTTPEQWYASFAASLIQSFRLEVQLGSWWRNHQELSLVRRLATFFEEILLPQVPGPIVLFIDEVDSVMALTFPTDDFFALIRATYDRRSEMPEYRRLTWALFGVATPAALIRDPQRTPLNIGRAIQLRGFQDHEVFPLACGLVGKVNQPMAVLKAILYWTAGQPFLTQKLCQLTMQSSQSTIQGTLNLPPGTESFWVEQLVHKHILQDWEAQDYPEHLRTIRDRLLFEPRGRRDRLLLYRQLLLREQSNPVPDEPEEVSPKNQNSPSRPLADLSLDSTRGISPAPATQFVNSPTPPAEQLRLGTDWLGKSLEKSLDFEQVIFSSDRAIEPVLTELLLSGLVEQRQGRLQVKNPIYQAIFNLNWVDAQLATYDALELQSSTAPAQPSESPARSPMDQSSVARLSAAQVEPPPIALSDAIVSSTINPISDPSLESASLDRTAEVGSNEIVDQSKSSVDLATPTVAVPLVAVPLHPSSGSSLQQVEPALAQPIDSEDSTLAVPNPPSQIADRKDKLVSQSVLDAVPEEVKQMAQQHLQTQLLQEIQQLKQQRSWLVGCILFLLTIVVYQLLFR
ncbi:AAA-like domain-containing protein [Alkalinema sp. FACHB-956]|uniref:AAA-like domain-containing protein n=1 Tax=Alkalinema sp. FACHB-956 TaxID=2692768 RepID=UPI001687B13A|nr:AAA-like domain-containing protein [Alkalinema sp. FACHB-956]